MVAMATYSSHRLNMGKIEIDPFCCLSGDIWNLFSQFFVKSSTFNTTFVQIIEFDWLPGRQEG